MSDINVPASWIKLVEEGDQMAHLVLRRVRPYLGDDPTQEDAQDVYEFARVV